MVTKCHVVLWTDNQLGLEIADQNEVFIYRDGITFVEYSFGLTILKYQDQNIISSYLSPKSQGKNL